MTSKSIVLEEAVGVLGFGSPVGFEVVPPSPEQETSDTHKKRNVYSIIEVFFKHILKSIS